VCVCVCVCGVCVCVWCVCVCVCVCVWCVCARACAFCIVFHIHCPFFLYSSFSVPSLHPHVLLHSFHLYMYLPSLPPPPTCTLPLPPFIPPLPRPTPPPSTYMHSSTPLPPHNAHRTFYQLLVQKFNYQPAKLSKRSSSKGLLPRTSSPQPFFPPCYHSWRAETHVRACLKACNNPKHKVEGRGIANGRDGKRGGMRRGLGGGGGR